MCTSFCFLALLELTWHGSLSEQAILNTSHINYWFLSKCNCSQGNIPFYNFDSKVSSFYWVPHTPRKWTDKKADGYVNLRNVWSGSALSRYIVGTVGSFNSIPCFDSSQILFSSQFESLETLITPCKSLFNIPIEYTLLSWPLLGILPPLWGLHHCL